MKSTFTTWLCALVVMLSLGETRAGDFLAADQLESRQIAAANQGSISDFYDASQYDASGYAVAPNSVVDKSWKLKIDGTGQKTGTPGHQFRMYREAITEAKKPNVTSVHLDHGYNRALGLDPKTISPNRRPDVTSIYDNGMVRRVEVQSRTDVPSILSGRNSALDPQLIQNGFTPTPPVIIRPTTSR